MIGTRALPASDEEREELVALRGRWAQEHSIFVETIYSPFWQAGRWPALRDLQRTLDAAERDDLDLEDLASEMPDGLGSFNIQDGSVSLTVRALCGQPFVDDEFLEGFLSVVRLAVGRYRDPAVSGKITSGDVDELLGGRVELRRRVMLLFEHENWIFGGGTNALGDDVWDRDLHHPAVRRFLHVASIDDYLRAEALLRWPLIRGRPHVVHGRRGQLGGMVLQPITVNNSMTVTGGTVGQVNFADVVHNLDSKITAMRDRQPTAADALEGLRTAVLDAVEFDEDRKRDLVDNLDDLADQAGIPPEERRQGRIRASLDAIKQAAIVAGSVADAWQQWGHVLGPLLLK